MFATTFGMSSIIAFGLIWRLLLGGNPAEAVRAHLAKAVYSVFLPALVLHVMWQTPVNLDVLRIPVVAAAGALLALLIAALIYGDGKRVGGGKAAGALLLAAGFGNVTYLGLPVLTETFGPWAQSVAIQYDLFANTPLLFTLGIMLAGHFGSSQKPLHPLLELIKVPALWAAVAGLLLSLFAIPMPVWMDKSFGVLGAAVVPLMLLSIGMALRWQAGWFSR
ncbi:MAG: Auxin Efflux carrier, partial [Mariprofundaceae bacterium]|nr:Auxin Efflux carrier [Mariprofundaceae bacterium]